mmetsp:Transcript_3771/g.11331  ORF Transcript_3771/g.11331 Transcript_3771/m.11331 type:complete len:200 (+) Transcript_3771:13-612(+)
MPLVSNEKYLFVGQRGLQLLRRELQPAWHVAYGGVLGPRPQVLILVELVEHPDLLVAPGQQTIYLPHPHDVVVARSVRVFLQVRLQGLPLLLVRGLEVKSAGVDHLVRHVNLVLLYLLPDDGLNAILVAPPALLLFHVVRLVVRAVPIHGRYRRHLHVHDALHVEHTDLLDLANPVGPRDGLLLVLGVGIRVVEHDRIG